MTTAKPSRRRDAERSREDLLEAAAVLFDERGYDRTTIRDIGAQAGVDPSLIARYFDGKAGLYLAVLHRDNATQPPADLLAPGRARALIARVDRRGPGPIFRSAVQPAENTHVQAGVRKTLHQRLVTPLAERLAKAGVVDPQLRAEVAAAAFCGIVLARHTGTLTTLAAAPIEDVLRLVDQLLPGIMTG